MKKFLLLLGFLLLPIHALFASDVETEKLQWHLNRVEGILRKVDTSSLTEEQRVNRTKMLDRLHSYTEAGQFPNNDKFPGESVPFFRGSNGNLCAVGYLMDAAPEYRSFIENIVKINNTVRIMDVQNDPTLNAWAKKYGFSILELAMIQPTYHYSFKKSCSFFYPTECKHFTQLVPTMIKYAGTFSLNPYIIFDNTKPINYERRFLINFSGYNFISWVYLTILLLEFLSTIALGVLLFYVFIWKNSLKIGEKWKLNRMIIIILFTSLIGFRAIIYLGNF